MKMLLIARAALGQPATKARLLHAGIVAQAQSAKRKAKTYPVPL
jgi:fructose-specific component phosphotransferase system IIB-like protein